MMNPRTLCLVLVAMSMAGCANFSGLDTQGQRLNANTLHTAQSLSGVPLSSAAWPVAVAVPSVLPAELLGRRPDLIASAGAESLLGDAMFGSPSRFFNIAPTISLPIFDGGRLRADLDARDADYDLVVAQYNKTLVKPWVISATPCRTARNRPADPGPATCTE